MAPEPVPTASADDRRQPSLLSNGRAVTLATLASASSSPRSHLAIASSTGSARFTEAITRLHASTSTADREALPVGSAHGR
ncbi:hypothetical protein [Streptomyces sp. NPDC102462]|uniref:hypothetical protein n=1 Tax=Streptomyces sp. NPDC102462 TaxID=3366178 RepID=UPI00382C47DF